MRTYIRILLSLLVTSGSFAFADEDSDDKLPISKKEGEAIIQSCLKADAKSCYDYAFYAAKNLNNLATYRLALKRACGLKHLEACEQIEKDDSEGNAIRKKCEDGDVDSCVLYSYGRAQMYEDLIGAINYANKACKLGHQKSCDRVKAEQEKVLDGIGERHEN